MSQGKPPLIQHDRKPAGDSWTSIQRFFFPHNLVKELESVITLNTSVISLGDSY